MIIFNMLINYTWSTSHFLYFAHKPLQDYASRKARLCISDLSFKKKGKENRNLSCRKEQNWTQWKKETWNDFIK